MEAPRRANSAAPNRCLVDGVRGREMTSASRPEARNVCNAVLEVPLYHALGMVPSGSPVPGMK